MRKRIEIEGRTFNVEFDLQGQVIRVDRWVKGRRGTADHTRCLWYSRKGTPQSALVKGVIASAETSGAKS